MCILTTEVIGSVVGILADTVTVRYNEAQRVQSGSLMRTVFYGTAHCQHLNELKLGDEVLCQIQRVGSHNDEPLLAVRRIPEI